MTRRVLWTGLFTALVWASAFPGIRAGLRFFSPPQLILFRFGIAALFLFALCLRQPRQWPERQDLLRFFALGSLGVSGYQILLNIGQQSVPSGTASLIINTAPIWAALFSVFFLDEHLTKVQGLGIFFGFVGVVVIAGGRLRGETASLGILWVVFASLSHGSSFLVQKPLLRKYTPLTVTTFTILFGLVPLLPWTFSTARAVALAPWKGIATVVYLGLFPAGIAYVSWNRVVAALPVSRAASFLYLIAPFSLAIAWLWHGEVPGWSAWVGGFVALAGVYVVLRGASEPTPPVDEAA